MSDLTPIPLWGRFERAFTSARGYANPLQDAVLRVTFTAPDGQARIVDGFWDGGVTWRVRFAPDAIGEWRYLTECSDADNTGLHGHSGILVCGEPTGATHFQRHGPLRLSDDRRSLAHADGTPFLWLADTAWNAPLRATAEDWYERVRGGE